MNNEIKLSVEEAGFLADSLNADDWEDFVEALLEVCESISSEKSVKQTIIITIEGN